MAAMDKKEPLPSEESEPVGAPEAIAAKIWNMVEEIDPKLPSMQWKQPKVHFAVPPQLSREFDPEGAGEVLKAIERDYFEAPYPRNVRDEVYVAVESGKEQNWRTRTAVLAAGGLAGVMNEFMCGGQWCEGRGKGEVKKTKLTEKSTISGLSRQTSSWRCQECLKQRLKR